MSQPGAIIFVSALFSAGGSCHNNLTGPDRKIRNTFVGALSEGKAMLRYKNVKAF